MQETGSFIEEKLQEKIKRDTKKEAHKIKKARKVVNRPPYKSPFYWSLTLFLIPISVLFVLAYLAMTLAKMFGTDEKSWVLETLLKDQSTAENIGLGWVPVISQINDYRLEIFSVSIIIVCIIVICNFFYEHRQITKSKKLLNNQEKT